jgi:hypothetical protein
MGDDDAVVDHPVGLNVWALIADSRPWPGGVHTTSSRLASLTLTEVVGSVLVV